MDFVGLLMGMMGGAIFAILFNAIMNVNPVIGGLVLILFGGVGMVIGGGLVEVPGL